MAEVTIEEVPKQVKDIFNKGFTALERGNLDYAIELLFQCVEMEPRLLRARKYLRAAEIQKFKAKKGGLFGGKLSSLKGAGLMGSLGFKGNPEKAVLAIEKSLKDDPVNPRLAKAFAEAAISADLPEAALHTLETARDHNPKDIPLINFLGELYAKIGNTTGAKQCFERVCELAPDDPGALKHLKDAMALDSLSTDGWEDASKEDGSYRDLIKNTEEATLLEQQAKAVKTETDVDALILETEEKIAADPKNINYYRALARLYADKDAYDESIETIRKALELNPGDPELDDVLSRTQVKRYDLNIKNLRDAGDEEGAQAVTTEREHFVFNDLQDRVTRYPNDMSIRYDWGAILMHYEYYDEAVKEFQLAQRYPQKRIMALLNMAKCFKHKNLSDMARDQLETALSELTVMTEDKKDVLYELGILAEESADTAKAGEFYKQIYQADIGYKDIAQKVESLYSA